MENKEKNVYFSNIKYHLLFSTRYLRKVFREDDLKKRCLTLIDETCLNQGLELLDVECHENYVYLYVVATSQHSPHSIVASIKQATSSQLRKEFPNQTHANALWNRSYCVSTTRRFSENLINDYLNTQKKYK